MQQDNRNPNRSKSWSALLGFILLALLVTGAVFAIRWAVHVFQGLNREVAAAIVAALGTAVVTLLSVLATRVFERRGAVERAQQERRIPVYEEFVSGLLQFFGKTIQEPEVDHSADVTKLMAAFTEKVIIWGSDDVVQLWGRYQYQIRAAQTDEQRAEMTFMLEQLLLGLRRDLGHANKKLGRGDLLKTFITDIQAT